MTSVTFDGSELNDLRLALEGVGPEAVDEGKKVLGKGALNIKVDAKAKASGIGHAPHYPRTITYDTTWTGTLGEAEIGPDKAKGGQAHLGNFLEYGDPRTPPQAHLGPALDYEGPRFVEQVEKLGVDVLEAL